MNNDTIKFGYRYDRDIGILPPLESVLLLTDGYECRRWVGCLYFSGHGIDIRQAENDMLRKFINFKDSVKKGFKNVEIIKGGFRCPKLLA